MSLLIDNRWTTGEAAPMESFSPDETQTVWQGHAASEQQVDRAIASAQAAFQSWSGLGFETRLGICRQFAEVLQANRDQLANTIHLETGKPLWECLTEVTAMVNKIAISETAYQQRTGNQDDGTRHLRHRPHGVLAVFGPYNFPGHLPNGHIVPALLAGNTVVLKPSELTPATAEATLKLWLQTDLPPGVINLVQGSVAVGIRLIENPIAGVLFTGSSATGQTIHRQLAGRTEVICALEMGGNNPLILSPEHAPDFAAATILQSAFLSTGQRCTCARRLIMVESEACEQTLRAVLDLASKITIGRVNMHQPQPFMGPVINGNTAKRLLAAQHRLQELGGQTLAEMKPHEHDAYLSPGIIDMTPCLQSDAPRNSTAPDQEWFGPLLQVYRVKSVQEAIDLANHTRYGLAAGFIGDHTAEQGSFLNQIRAGVTSVNAPTAGASSAMPFGGVGCSGNHRPSAFYAADYCAWPQASNINALSRSQSVPDLKGIQQ